MPVYLLLRNEKERDKTPEVWQRYSGRLDKSVHHQVDITGSLLLFGKCDDTLVSPVPVGDLLHIAYRLNPPCISISCILVERSEEHTSELQSRGHLVCRLLLEKQKTKL